MATICLSGLDMSFLKNSKPIQLKKPKRDTRDLRSPLGGPMLMKDIAEFVSVAGDKPERITSRSQLARHERSNNMRQCGNDLKGRIVPREKKRIQDGLDSVRQARGVKVEAKWI